MTEKDTLWQQELATPWIQSLSNHVPLHDLVQKNRISEKKELTTLECCDGRCPRIGTEIFIAGSGILLDEVVLVKFIIEHKIKKITSHAACGAGALAYSLLLPEEAVKYSNAEVYTQEWTKAFAKKHGLEYEHISKTDLTASLHHEMGLIIDTTYDFHPSLFAGIPNMFVSNSARFASGEYIKNEVSVLVNIGFGDHGFGSFFNKKQPFNIFIGARSQKEATKLLNLCSETFEHYPSQMTIQLLNY